MSTCIVKGCNTFVGTDRKICVEHFGVSNLEYDEIPSDSLKLQRDTVTVGNKTFYVELEIEENDGYIFSLDDVGQIILTSIAPHVGPNLSFRLKRFNIEEHLD